MATHPGRDAPEIPLGAEVDDLGEALEVFGRVGAGWGCARGLGLARSLKDSRSQSTPWSATPTASRARV
jgi:hypothetical protein